MDRGLADQLEQLLARLRAHDRFVRRAEGGEHPAQTVVLNVRRAKAVGAVEPAQRQIHGFGEFSQPLYVVERGKHPSRVRPLTHRTIQSFLPASMSGIPKRRITNLGKQALNRRGAARRTPWNGIGKLGWRRALRRAALSPRLGGAFQYISAVPSEPLRDISH